MCQQKGAFAVILFSPLRGVVHIVWKLRVFFTTCHLCSCSQLCISSYIQLPMLEESNKQQMYGNFEGFPLQWMHVKGTIWGLKYLLRRYLDPSGKVMGFFGAQVMARGSFTQRLQSYTFASKSDIGKRFYYQKRF